MAQWTGNNSGDPNDAGNWSPAVVPTNGASVQITNATGSLMSSDFSTSRTFGSLTINDSGYAGGSSFPNISCSGSTTISGDQMSGLPITLGTLATTDLTNGVGDTPALICSSCSDITVENSALTDTLRGGTFSNITIDSGGIGAVTVNGTVTVTGTLNSITPSAIGGSAIFTLTSGSMDAGDISGFPTVNLNSNVNGGTVGGANCFTGTSIQQFTAALTVTGALLIYGNTTLDQSGGGSWNTTIKIRRTKATLNIVTSNGTMPTTAPITAVGVIG